MSTSVDDRHASITYQGRWTSRSGDPKFYGSTVSATNNNGATATFKFKGTKVKLYLVVPSGTSGTIKIGTSLDNGSPYELERHVHPNNVYYNDNWFESGILSDTEHTVVVTNIGVEGGNAVQVDRFDIDGSPITPSSPQPPPPPPPQPPSPPPPSTTTPAITGVMSQTALIPIQTSTVNPSISASLTDPSSSTTTLGSSGADSLISATPGGVSSSPSSHQSTGERTVTAIQILTTAPNGSVQTIITTPGQQAATGNSSDQVSLGAIIGGIVGAIVLLVIAVILAFLLIRRRKKRIVLVDDSEKLTHQRGAISPFAAEDQDDTPPNSASVLRQRPNGTTITNSRSPSAHHHAFNSDEKNGDPYSSNSALEADVNDSNHGVPTSENTALPPIESGRNIHIRPHYLSGETMSAESIYPQAGALSTIPRDHLRLQDSCDIPPAYQSVGNRSSDVRRSIMNSAYLSCLSPRYSDRDLGFVLGSPPVEPQYR